MRTIIIIAFYLLLLPSIKISSQGCCSGGSGNPIVGEISQSLLHKNQIELSFSYQYQNSNKFKALNKDTARLFDKLYGNYLYYRASVGVSERLTFSAETGLFLNKTQIELHKLDTIQSSGIGDLIIFPKYQLLNKTTLNHITEIVLGLGYKIPLGKYNDSTLIYTNVLSGKEYYNILPPSLQPTTGSQDILFYSSALSNYTKRNIVFFTNFMYIKKGWNPLGQKFGDYTSIGLAASKSFYEKFGVTLLLKAEYISKMKSDKYIDQLALYNVYIESTGGRKLLFLPQLNYSNRNFTFYVLSELPLYQFVNGTQVVSQYQFTVGLSYRFFTKNPECQK